MVSSFHGLLLPRWTSAGFHVELVFHLWISNWIGNAGGLYHNEFIKTLLSCGKIKHVENLLVKHNIYLHSLSNIHTWFDKLNVGNLYAISLYKHIALNLLCLGISFPNTSYRLYFWIDQPPTKEVLNGYSLFLF